ncbi:DsrE family protein [Fulvivirga sp. M361]|uniref:DsrE family protein n=1 Tax=Fulvivirga sp. M361 TaxID=2594266 RepID=UPI001179A225|nr:DsrE family protein [Fulvivirga sp. M361]TRX51600.1 DsrE family protein [Fulvivirga sp. M361]
MIKTLICSIGIFVSLSIQAQEKINPVIKNFGGIYDIPEATVKADPEAEYKVIIDVVSGASDPKEIAWGLKNVARMINLHAVSGADISKMKVVLAIHGPVAYTIMKNSAFKDRFGTDNPNIALIKELKDAGVKLAVCGQSLIGREIPVKKVLPEVEIATSMLTTVTTYQLKGYVLLKF